MPIRGRTYLTQLPQPPLPQDPHPPAGPVGLLHEPQPPSSAQPPCFTPLPFGSSYRRQHFNRPHMPDSFDGFRLRFCCLAILMEMGSNAFSHVVQQSGRPQGPYPPSIRASSRTPICRISMRVLK